eukprot:m.687110 g.687110  ORF g.687110 m.687110 type:complete len:401 (+) comp22840_c0_seq59:3068-4270(+)
MSSTVSDLEARLSRQHELLSSLEEKITKRIGRNRAERQPQGSRNEIGNRLAGDRRDVVRRDVGPRRDDRGRHDFADRRGMGMRTDAGRYSQHQQQTLVRPLDDRKRRSDVLDNRLGPRVDGPHREYDTQRKVRRVAAWEGSDDEDAPAVSSRPPLPPVPDVEPAPRPRRRSDRQDNKRNVRMLGFLNATLKSARGRTATQEKAEAKRQEVAKKLLAEKEQNILERHKLFYQRIKAQLEIEKLETSMVEVHQQQHWDKHNKTLENFILLKSSPQIFFLPAKHNKKTRALLADNGDTMAAFARSRREQAGAVTTRRLEARLDKFVEKTGKTKAELEAPLLDVPETPSAPANGTTTETGADAETADKGDKSEEPVDASGSTEASAAVEEADSDKDHDSDNDED